MSAFEMGCTASSGPIPRQSAVSGSAEMAPETERAVPACSRVMTRSTGCVISVATAPEAQPATKSAVFSAMAVVSRASRRPGGLRDGLRGAEIAWLSWSLFKARPGPTLYGHDLRPLRRRCGGRALGAAGQHQQA
eukprot:scaffold48110_cov55-Phaeocystis_antarctica.AAC.2